MITVLHFIVDILNYAWALSLPLFKVDCLLYTVYIAIQLDARQQNNMNMLNEKSIRREPFYSRWFSIAHSLFRFTLSFCIAASLTYYRSALFARGCAFGCDMYDSFLICALYQCTHIFVVRMKKKILWWEMQLQWDWVRERERQRETQGEGESSTEKVWLTVLCTVAPKNGN